MAVLVLQHIACEPPGVFEDVLVEAGHAIRRIELDEGEALPHSFDGVDALVVMGGPMGAYEGDGYPWLLGELAFIRRAVETDLPFLGVCLGAQLLAHAVGGRAYPGGAGPEVGVLPVDLTPAAAGDELFAGLAPQIEALQWHGDTFDLPPGSTLLASSPLYPHQAFRYRNAWGLQFHVEVTHSMAEEWALVPAYQAALESVRGPGGFDSLMTEFQAGEQAMVATARALGERFSSLVSASSL